MILKLILFFQDIILEVKGSNIGLHCSALYDMTERAEEIDKGQNLYFCYCILVINCDCLHNNASCNFQLLRTLMAIY